MTVISMLQRTFWLWDSQLLPVERWSDLDGRKLAQAHLREAGKPTREGGNPAWGAGNPLGLPMGRMSTCSHALYLLSDGLTHLSCRCRTSEIGCAHLPY